MKHEPAESIIVDVGLRTVMSDQLYNIIYIIKYIFNDYLLEIPKHSLVFP